MWCGRREGDQVASRNCDGRLDWLDSTLLVPLPVPFLMLFQLLLLFPRVLVSFFSLLFLPLILLLSCSSIGRVNLDVSIGPPSWFASGPSACGLDRVLRQCHAEVMVVCSPFLHAGD